MSEIKLTQVRRDQYECELTKKLDRLAQFPITRYGHYLLCDTSCLEERCLPIRVPGRTVGGVWFDKDKTIIDINISNSCWLDGYPDNINDILKKYIGYTIEF